MAHAWKACWVQALGGSNPPSSATGPRDRFRFRGFCCLWRRWCCLWCRWCSGRRRARPPARSPHASFARSGRSRSPPVPSGPSGALHTGGAWCADVWLGASARCPARPRHRPPHQCDLNVARNSPAATSNFEFGSLQLQRLWIGSKSDRGKLCATFVWLWPCRCPPASEISCVKPASPLLARLCVGLKPPSPLRAKRSCFSCIFRLQWCRRFHAGLHQWLQRCYWFQSWHVAVFCARKSSPCSARCGREREKVRPAHEKWLKIGVLWRAGRVFSR